MRVPSTDGVELELHDLGGDGPPLLLAHATGFCAGAYRPLANALQRAFHVWGIDFRGHGEATAPAGGSYDWTGMGEDVLACVDALGVEPGGLRAFGHSMGGAALALAELTRPGLLHGAFLFEPIIVPSGFGIANPTGPDGDPISNPLAASARRRRPSFPSKLEALGRYASRPPLGTFRADALFAYVEHGFVEQPDGSVTLRCPPEVEAATFEAPGKPEIPLMGSITAPLTFAKGSDLSPGPGPFAVLAHEQVAGSTLRTYEHLGHFGPFQDPDTMAADIVDDLA